MVFSSVIFLFFFLPVVLTLYSLPSQKWRNFFFVAASFFFYAWSEGGYLLVLVVSIACNYLFGLLIQRRAVQETLPPGESSKNAVLVFGLVFNLALLVFFKYSNFLAANLNVALGSLGLSPIVIPPVYAPLGISFFTFHAISYLIDIQRGEAHAAKNPGAIALYIAAFPKIMAGPILRYAKAAGQIAARTFTTAEFVYGMERFLTGLAKKVLLANPLATVADAAFALQPESLSAFSSWVGILCFTLQIYYDFSGYSDMAIGIGKMFGFDLPENFNFPYISESVREFWRRWHISLSLWFRDYLYIPLGGNRYGHLRTNFNLIAVFLLCGLWHGASWNFIIWGGWYGLFLVLERTRLGGWLESAPRFLRHFYLLAVVIIGWVFFRADNLTHASTFLSAMFGLHSGSGSIGRLALHLNSEVFFLFAAASLLCMPVAEGGRKFVTSLISRQNHSGSPAVGLGICYGLFLSVMFFLSVMALAGGTHKAFIYFKF
ncbi:MAG: MBOAT family protein [Syntrophobacteraceae bacterium]